MRLSPDHRPLSIRGDRFRLRALLWEGAPRCCPRSEGGSRRAGIATAAPLPRPPRTLFQILTPGGRKRSTVGKKNLKWATRPLFYHVRIFSFIFFAAGEGANKWNKVFGGRQTCHQVFPYPLKCSRLAYKRYWLVFFICFA